MISCLKNCFVITWWWITLVVIIDRKFSSESLRKELECLIFKHKWFEMPRNVWKIRKSSTQPQLTLAVNSNQIEHRWCRSWLFHDYIWVWIVAKLTQKWSHEQMRPQDPLRHFTDSLQFREKLNWKFRTIKLHVLIRRDSHCKFCPREISSFNANFTFQRCNCAWAFLCKSSSSSKTSLNLH